MAYISLSTGTGALILFGSVQVTMLIAAFRSGERMWLTQWVGFGVAVVGLVYLVSPGISAPNPIGAVLMAISGIAWGLYSIAGRGVSTPIAMTSGNFLWAASMTFVASALAFSQVHLEASGVILALVSGVLTSGFGYVLWYKTLPLISTTQASIVQLLVPVLAALGGVDLHLRANYHQVGCCQRAHSGRRRIFGPEERPKSPNKTRMINCLAAEGRKSHDNSNLNPDIGVRFQAACGSTVTLPRNQMENKAFIRPRPIFSIVAIMFSLSLSQGCATFASGPSNEERLSVCADRLVSYSDWSEAEGQAWHLDIHVSNGGRLHYFGAVHSSDPKHPQMAEIEERWNQVEPTLAFYEGPNRGIGADAFETISKYGESGYTRYLADQAGHSITPAQSPSGRLLKAPP